MPTNPTQAIVCTRCGRACTVDDLPAPVATQAPNSGRHFLSWVCRGCSTNPTPDLAALVARLQHYRQTRHNSEEHWQRWVTDLDTYSQDLLTAAAQLAEAQERARVLQSEVPGLSATLDERTWERDTLRTERDRLRGLLADALDLAEEGWGYASDYFQDKYDSKGRIAAIRAELEPKP